MMDFPVPEPEMKEYLKQQIKEDIKLLIKKVLHDSQKKRDNNNSER